MTAAGAAPATPWSIEDRRLHIASAEPPRRAAPPERARLNRDDRSSPVLASYRRKPAYFARSGELRPSQTSRRLRAPRPSASGQCPSQVGKPLNINARRDCSSAQGDVRPDGRPRGRRRPQSGRCRAAMRKGTGTAGRRTPAPAARPPTPDTRIVPPLMLRAAMTCCSSRAPQLPLQGTSADLRARLPQKTGARMSFTARSSRFRALRQGVSRE